MKINGLSEKEVNDSRKKYGSNELKSIKKRNSFFKLFLESLGDPIIKILLMALAIKILFLFRSFDFYETFGIIISILAASLLSTISEYGSEAAFQKLEEESSKIKVKVLRNREKKEICIEDVVVDDIVILQSGDRIPADGAIINGKIEIDESAINGESDTKEKTIKDYIYRGTIITNGEALLKVQKVGKNTMYGDIAKNLEEKSSPSPLKIRLTELAKSISKLGYIGAILVSLSYLFSKIILENNFNITLILQDVTNFKVMFNYFINAATLAVTVIVVSVPEGLPLMVTLVLSSNMRRMLKDHVLVRKLVGIETSGNINYLLTDKTGTITKGKLEVIKLVTSNLDDIKLFSEIKNNNFKETIYKSFFYNNSSKFNNLFEVIGGNNTDKALLEFIKKDYKLKDYVSFFLPFNSQNKFSLVTLNNDISYIKGAPEIILEKCTKSLTVNNELSIFNEEKMKKIVENYAARGFRVIALALSNSYHITSSVDNLTFIGLAIIKDDLRSEAKESINQIKNAGIKTIMITGDNLNTAKNIARESGIISSPNDLVLTSSEFKKMTDEEVINIHKNIKVIARAMPNDKSRLVNILKNLNYVVGMTGDGVNDAPALKKADVGFAMGSGTEIAKEASDIVILDDKIKSISKAILYGRTILKNIRKFLIFQLSINICAILVSVIGPIIGIDTPITIVQMLWINMIMDTLAGIAFSYEPPLKEYMDEEPLKLKTQIINKYMINEIFISGIYQAIICLLFLKLPFIDQIIRQDSSNKYLLTAYFTLFVFMGVFNSFNARTIRKNICANLKNNKAFIIITLLIIIFQLLIIYKGGNTFRTYGLTIKELSFVILLSFSIIPIDLIRKIVFKNKFIKR